ncbi:AAA family ATPase [Nostocoides sp. F2B08]|uniref:AAA family ATPase n=1 Tax=Nostocoides sp. F2B08 TaxID=2653936 RepID=UPI0012639E7A|nr:AAA family ATPase [Tetrasphaera sp. F2B08]KAB7745590.1 AAA family ATPase [Tetrasphaera sp. F2B08]
MHELVPRPLLDAVAAGADSWRSVGPVLSIDLVGFTSMAWTLAANGDRGAEALADIADAVFGPIVEAVHTYGGYVAEFGGDAILAIFPPGPNEMAHHADPDTDPEPDHGTVLDAAAAALAISDAAGERGPIHTRFGRFEVGVKVALVAGEVRWDVLDDDSGSRSTYVAWGRAVEEAAELAATGRPGEVLVDPATAYLLRQSLPIEDRDGRHLFLTTDLARPARPLPALPQPQHPLAARFAPDRLLTWDRRGELRPVLTAFLGMAHDAPIEDVRRLVSDIFRLTETYGGVLHQIERAEKGWVILLYWGTPVSFPGDVERALSLLLALRAQSPVRFRAGATVGTAFSGFVGAPVQVGFTCYGSHINLAARLMGLATAGSVLVDGSVLGNAAGVATCTSLGMRELKGVGAPVEVFELAALGGGVVAREHRIVGRDAELATLHEAVARTAAVGRLHRVSLVGEPGCGKSALLDLLRRREEGVQGLHWLVCRSESHGVRWLQPVRDLVGRWSGVSGVDGVAANSARFTARLDELADALSTDLGDRLRDRASFLAALLDLPVPGSTWAATPPEDRFEGMVDAVSTLLVGLVATGPLVVVLEDVQWLDPTSRELLDRVLEALADSPVTVIATCQEGEQVPSPVDGDGLVVRIGSLGVEELDQLARSLLGHAPPPWLGGWLARRTEGNPLFAEQLVTYLAGEGLLAPDAPEPAADVAVPPDLRGIIVARFDRLSSPARSALETGAVLGRRFERHVLRRTLAVVGVEATRQAEEEVLAAGLWTADQDNVAFTHQFLWTAATDMPLTSTLRSLHAAAATALEDVSDEGTGRYVGRLAVHHREAGHLGESARYESRASEQALLLGAYADAERHAELGLHDLETMAKSGADRPADLELTLLLALGSGRMITRGQSAPETYEAYERARRITESLPPTRQSFQAVFGLRMAAAFRGDLRGAGALGQHALAMAKEIGDEDLILEATLMIGNTAFWHGRLDEAIDALRQVRQAEVAASHGEFVQQRRLTALFPLLLSQWLVTGDPGLVEVAEQGVAEARALAHRFSEAITLETAAFLAVLDGDVVRARRHGTELLDLAESEPFPVYAQMARAVLGWEGCSSDRSPGAADDVGRAVHELAGMRVILGQTLMECFHADAALAAGDPAHALRATDSGLRRAERTGEAVMTPMLHLLRARASSGAEREDELRQARSLAEGMGQRHVVALVDSEARAGRDAGRTSRRAELDRESHGLNHQD